MSAPQGSHPASMNELPFVAPCRPLAITASFGWLQKGWRDMARAPLQSLFYGVLLTLLSMAIAVMTWRLGLIALYLGLASGFVFIGPFLAVGLYSISYQLEIAALLKALNRERQTTMVISTHDLNLAAALCERVVLLKQGTVLAHGATNETINAANIRAAYGVDAEVRFHPQAGHLTVVPIARAS